VKYGGIPGLWIVAHTVFLLFLDCICPSTLRFSFRQRLCFTALFCSVNNLPHFLTNRIVLLSSYSLLEGLFWKYLFGSIGGVQLAVLMSTVSDSVMGVFRWEVIGVAEACFYSCLVVFFALEQVRSYVCFLCLVECYTHWNWCGLGAGMHSLLYRIPLVLDFLYSGCNLFVLVGRISGVFSWPAPSSLEVE